MVSKNSSASPLCPQGVFKEPDVRGSVKNDPDPLCTPFDERWKLRVAKRKSGSSVRLVCVSTLQRSGTAERILKKFNLGTCSKIRRYIKMSAEM